MTEWLPIESAPKSGDHCLGYDQINNRVYEFWMMASREGGFYPMIYQTQSQYEITHWMPLPEPPKDEHHCKSSCGDWICMTNKNTERGLVLVDYRNVCTEVVACPFCGEKANG